MADQWQPQPHAPRKGLAIASLVLGILSVPTLGLLFVGACAGIGLGIAALMKAKQSPQEYGGKGMAIVGLVMSALSLLAIPFIGIIAAIAIPSLLRARVSANEAMAIGDIRTVISAEAAYAAGNGEFFDTLECLTQPTSCRPNAPTIQFLTNMPPTKSGYVRTFHPGPPAPPAALATGSISPSSLQSYAFSAVPLTQGRTGVRAFCGDATGVICQTTDGSAPAVADGRCVVAGSYGDLAQCATSAGVSELPAAPAPDPPAAPAPDPPAADAGGGRLATSALGAVRVGGSIREPRKIKDVRPSYPDIAQQARVQGVVILEVMIDPAGEVTDVKVLRGIPLLDHAAIEAVRQWVYTPTLLNGQPVPVIMTVTVNFRLT